MIKIAAYTFVLLEKKNFFLIDDSAPGYSKIPSSLYALRVCGARLIIVYVLYHDVAGALFESSACYTFIYVPNYMFNVFLNEMLRSRSFHLNGISGHRNFDIHS